MWATWLDIDLSSKCQLKTWLDDQSIIIWNENNEIIILKLHHLKCVIHDVSYCIFIYQCCFELFFEHHDEMFVERCKVMM